MKSDLFQPCGHHWAFKTCWHIECSTFTASSSRTWNSSTGIPSPSLALFIVMLPNCDFVFHMMLFNCVWHFVIPRMTYSRGFPVLHSFTEFAQTLVSWVNDPIQPSHTLSSASPPSFKLSQIQGLFQLVSSSQQMAKILEFQLQHQSFQWIYKTDFL